MVYALLEEVVMGLGIREARSGLSELVKRAAQKREEFRIGVRGADETTLIATAELERLRRRVAQLEAENRERAGGDAPFAGLMRRVQAGEFAAGDEPRRRRRIPGLTQESSLSRAEMARLGSLGDTQPRYRRTKPRA
jgi:hypothetical protein